MNHRPAKLDYARKRRLDIRHLEVRQRPAVARAWSALVHAELYATRTRLQTATLVLLPLAEGRAEQPFPEVTRPLEIVSRELNQPEHHSRLDRN
jgi:hypothetical protein